VRRLLAAAIIGAGLLAGAAGAATPPLVVTTADPFTNSTSQHQTAVEPDSFAWGSTIVEAAQVGRFYDGGASDIAWGSSLDGGQTWKRAPLPGLTKFQGGGTFDRVSDPSVAYDAKHGVWMISSLGIYDQDGISSPTVVVSRSLDARHWGSPVTVATVGDLDKDWIVCDNWPASAFYGHCYAEFDEDSAGDLFLMSTSVDGGLTWSAPKATANSARGLGGQPVVRPNGMVVVPAIDASESNVIWFSSSNGGTSWTSSQTVAAIHEHFTAGGMRTEALPSAEVDKRGRVYLVWQDCRFRTSCSANDIVMSIYGGTSWTAPARIPIDSTTSGVDHFIPGLAVDPATSRTTAHLALTYYFFPVSGCSASTCQLEVGFVSSTTGGSSWTAPKTLAGPMKVSWLPATSLGLMVGDYISTSFSGGLAFPFFSVALASTSTFNQTIRTTAAGIAP
jgi:BNR repeat-like domain